MAENLRDVPVKYGTRPEGFYPRINSYGRRLLSVAPAIVFAAAVLVLVFTRRTSVPFVTIAVVLLVISAVIIYSVLRPAIAVVTETHVLQGRMIGWKAVPLEKARHAVFVERMQPKAARNAPETALARLRYRGIPGLWITGSKGRSVMRFDGRVWDAKTLQKISGKCTPQTTVYRQINIIDLDEKHPGMLGFGQKHPKFLSSALTILGVLVLGALLLMHFRPDLTGGLAV